jgi:hypothetical protein
MLIFAKQGCFLQWCADKEIGHLLFATHPHRLAIRELTLVDTPSLPIGLG